METFKAEYKHKEIPREKKIEYLDKLLEQTEKLYNAFFIMNPLVMASEVFDYDINDFIAKDYPFNYSFDELVLEVGKWVNTVEKNISEELARLDNLTDNLKNE